MARIVFILALALAVAACASTRIPMAVDGNGQRLPKGSVSETNAGVRICDYKEAYPELTKGCA